MVWRVPKGRAPRIFEVTGEILFYFGSAIAAFYMLNVNVQYLDV